MKNTINYKISVIRRIIVAFTFAVMALLSFETCYASETNDKLNNYKREYKYAEKKLENIIPKSAINFAKDNYLDILQTSCEYDKSLTFASSYLLWL